jgi:hypothetical protein
LIGGITVSTFGTAFSIASFIGVFCVLLYLVSKIEKPINEIYPSNDLSIKLLWQKLTSKTKTAN